MNDFEARLDKIEAALDRESSNETIVVVYVSTPEDLTLKDRPVEQWETWPQIATSSPPTPYGCRVLYADATAERRARALKATEN